MGPLEMHRHRRSPSLISCHDRGRSYPQSSQMKICDRTWMSPLSQHEVGIENSQMYEERRLFGPDREHRPSALVSLGPIWRGAVPHCPPEGPGLVVRPMSCGSANAGPRPLEQPQRVGVALRLEQDTDRTT